MAKTKVKEQNFETSLSALERVVSQLESGDLPLEQALELFEEGVILARNCQSQLHEAERKVEMLLRERGEIRVVPFEKDGQAGGQERIQNQNPAGSVRQAEIPTKDEEGEDKDDLDDAIPF